MADEGDLQPVAERKGRGRLLQIAIIGALMLGEGIGVFLLANSLSASPDLAVGAEGGTPGAGSAADDADALAEVELAECRPGNSTSGKYISFNIRVTALIALADRKRVEELVEQKSARIQDRINYVVRSADLRHLHEPGFETLRRRLKHEMDQVFNDDTLIQGILIPELLQ